MRGGSSSRAIASGNPGLGRIGPVRGGSGRRRRAAAAHCVIIISVGEISVGEDAGMLADTKSNSSSKEGRRRRIDASCAREISLVVRMGGDATSSPHERRRRSLQTSPPHEGYVLAVGAGAPHRLGAIVRGQRPPLHCPNRHPSPWRQCPRHRIQSHELILEKQTIRCSSSIKE